MSQIICLVSSNRSSLFKVSSFVRCRKNNWSFISF